MLYDEQREKKKQFYGSSKKLFDVASCRAFLTHHKIKLDYYPNFKMTKDTLFIFFLDENKKKANFLHVFLLLIQSAGLIGLYC